MTFKGYYFTDMKYFLDVPSLGLKENETNNNKTWINWYPTGSAPSTRILLYYLLSSEAGKTQG